MKIGRECLLLKKNKKKKRKLSPEILLNEYVWPG